MLVKDWTFVDSHSVTLPNPAQNVRKRPRQARSVVMVNIILEAAARILEADGLAKFTTNAIAERAGVSVGSVYQYFPAKGALVRELIRRKRTELVTALEHQRLQMRGMDLPAAIDGFIRVAIANQLDRPQLARILEYLEAVSPANGETESIKQMIVATVATSLTDQGVSDAAMAARDIVALTRGMVDAAGLFGDAHIPSLEGRIRRAIYGYLGLQAPSELRVAVAETRT
jgi:AcrR family transcriptional regulator